MIVLIEFKNTIQDDTFKVSYSDKIAVNDNQSIQVIEKVVLEKDTNEVKINNVSGFTIKKVGSKVKKSISIFLTNKDEFSGFISATVHEDNTASITMSNINAIPLPPQLDEYRNYLLNEVHQDVALFVDRKYRHMGIAKCLIYLMLNYLNELGIEEVKVYGITNDVALKTYLSTGAFLIDNKTAVYQNLSQLLDNNITDRKRGK